MKSILSNRETLKKIYCNLVKIRKFEEKIIELYPKQEMKCPVHLYIGQEAIAVGFCMHLNKDDYVFSNHRNHGHLIAKGVDLKPIFAELYGKKTGCSSGKGGSMHLISMENSIMGTSAIVGGGIPIAVGTALASKMIGNGNIAVVFFGDGAVDEGVFYECLNFSALKKLPIIFVCENNLYATNSPQKVRQINQDIYKIAEFFLMPGVLVDGNNVFEVYKTAEKYIKKARNGDGPSLIEARTYRWRTHVGPETDIEKGFRNKEEVEEWLKKCPLKKFKEIISENNLIKKEELEDIDKKVNDEIMSALDFALSSPYPQEEDLYKNVY
jgi:pyruvate dehydrogenase E1 component alpha subunit